AQINVKQNREWIELNARCFQKDEQEISEMLAAMIRPRAFPEWNLKKIWPNVERETECAKQDPYFVLVEEAHRLAFRSGLGNSLLASGPVTSQGISEFFKPGILKVEGSSTPEIFGNV